MPVSSREKVRVPWAAGANAFPVQIAIVLKSAGEPAEADYRPAIWDGDDAVLLVGAGTDLELAVGEYVVWSRITTATERPVRRSGMLTVGTP
jgi:hypothetical protein